tara:strand:- start:2399 stop:2725 length:327 start_codon:yes stop_codon:yes gene_type:complete
MNFKESEDILNQIQSEIKKSESKISNLITKNEVKNNKFVKEVYENIIEYQKKIVEEKIKQMEKIDKLHDYLEKYEDLKNFKKIRHQQKKLEKTRKKIKLELEKYLKTI